MSFVWISAVKDFKRRLRDPVAMLLWLGIPVLIGGLLSLVMGGGSSGTIKAKLFFVDQDDSLITQLIAGMAQRGGEDSMIELIEVDQEEARRRLDEGEGSALLVIPEGFGQALLDETPVELRLVTNPSQQVLPGILEEGLRVLIEGAFYTQRVLGENLAALSSPPVEGNSFLASALVASRAASINDRMQQLEGVLFPPLIDFEIEILEEEDAPVQSIGLLLFPGILFLAMLFIAQGMSADLWMEHEYGTLRRVLSTPTGMKSFLLGKVLAGGLIVALVTGLGLVMGVLFFDLPTSNFIPGLLWGSFSGLVLLPFFMWLQVLGATQQAGNVLTTLLLFPLMMLGGSLFPFEAMPSWMVNVGKWTPNGKAMAELKVILASQVETGALLEDILALSAFGLVMFFLTARRAAGRFIGA
ncbi:MAG: ABC-type multidrug transport system permease subunit [Planctomycetota bacterium]|jgi:ABC-type multidrug transport system permease subunit